MRVLRGHVCSVNKGHGSEETSITVLATLRKGEGGQVELDVRTLPSAHANLGLGGGKSLAFTQNGDLKNRIIVFPPPCHPTKSMTETGERSSSQKTNSELTVCFGEPHAGIDALFIPKNGTDKEK